MNPHVSTLVEDITKILIRKIVRFFGLYCLILSQCTIPQKKKQKRVEIHSTEWIFRFIFTFPQIL